MTDYVKDWLGAYLDGELTDDRRAWVEEHLANCPVCRKELAELRALSSLLKEDPAPASWTEMDGEVFTERVIRRLPRVSAPFSRRALRAGLRYAPLGLFGAWAFCQAVILVSAALLWALNLFPQAGAGLTGLGLNPGNGAAGGASTWLGWIFTTAGLNGTVVDLAENAWLGPLALINLLVIVGLSVLFMAWLAGFWSYQKNQAE